MKTITQKEWNEKYKDYKLYKKSEDQHYILENSIKGTCLTPVEIK